VIGQKAKLLTAIILAPALAISLLEISYLLIPEQVPIPLPEPSMFNQLFGAILWIGIAALIAVAVVGSTLAISRVRRKEDKETETPLL
jgi:hypothetical protein